MSTSKPNTEVVVDHDFIDVVSSKLKFKNTDQGLFLISSNIDDEKPDLLEYVCARLDVVAVMRDMESSQWSRLVKWHDPDGIQHELSIPLSLLQGDGAEVRRVLAVDGLDISPQPKMRYAMLRYIAEAHCPMRAWGVEKTGWYRCSDGYAFVLPDCSIGTTKEIIRLQFKSTSQAYRLAGTAEQWRSEVAALCSGNSRCILALCTGFASMMLEFAGLESGGINIKGISSTGKTTALIAAASIFGGHNYINRWRATTKGLESLAAMHNDTLLILDELAQVDPKEAGEIAYLLANGQGKQRSSQTGAAKQRQSWRLLFLSAGEIGLVQHMAQGG